MDGVFNRNGSAFSSWNEIHGGSVVQIGNIYTRGNVNIGRDIIPTSVGSLADKSTSHLTVNRGAVAGLLSVRTLPNRPT
jgi:hypothetical protein